MVLLLMNQRLLLVPLFCACFAFNHCFFYEVFLVFSNFTIISLGKRELVALHLLHFDISLLLVLCVLLTVSRVGLQCVIVTFTGHTYLLCEKNEIHRVCVSKSSHRFVFVSLFTPLIFQNINTPYGLHIKTTSSAASLSKCCRCLTVPKSHEPFSLFHHGVLI